MQSRRTTLVSSQLVKKKKRKRILAISISLSVVCIFLLILFFVLRAPFLYIKDIRIEGNQITQSNQIEEMVTQLISENYFFFIPKKNRLIYPKKEIIKEIQSEFGRIEKINLKIEKNTLIVNITERGSYALWCKSEEECFFIDDTGLLFTEAPIFSDGVYQKFSGIITENEPIGKRFLNSETLKEIKLITDFLLTQKWLTEQIHVTTLRDAVLFTDKGFQIKIDLTKSAHDTVKILKTLISSDEFKKIVPQISHIEYLDVRFGSKVFFKSKHTPQGLVNHIPTL